MSGADGGVAPDLSGLVEQMGDEGLAADVVEVYLEALPERVAAIRAARDGGDEEAVRAAHSLKSASALLGLHDLSGRAAALEAALRQDPAGDPAPLVEAVLERTPGAEAALRQWLAGRRPTG
ncbi:Hpt domain-containing protein [Phycicoccus avicenniae]|uniref:Hpt domain-containing protein n=1 Tax=Phycicoccus avicenniae TaxID=2828860 RepID=UPI003D27D73A